MTAMIISKTDLARRTRQVVDQARRGQPVIVESYGEEQVAILDAIDYRLLQALASCHIFPSHLTPVSDDAMIPSGLDINEVEQTLQSLKGDGLQAAWNTIVAAYFVGDISLGRTAELLHLSRFDLQQRFVRLGLPIRSGPTDLAETEEEILSLR